MRSSRRLLLVIGILASIGGMTTDSTSTPPLVVASGNGALLESPFDRLAASVPRPPIIRTQGGSPGSCADTAPRVEPGNEGKSLSTSRQPCSRCEFYRMEPQTHGCNPGEGCDASLLCRDVIQLTGCQTHYDECDSCPRDQDCDCQEPPL